MARLFVAAGGGGDALAASIVHRALGGDRPAVVATYAWDRLAVDPLPGPRGVGDFDGLRPFSAGNLAVTPTTTPRPPAGSTLPRLAGQVADTLVLLDPAGGAVGMRRQLARLVDAVGARAVTVVDVGGDVVASGDEPGLRSPLADGLALAACAGLAVPVTVVVTGVGLDGELSEADVLAAVDRLPSFRLRAEDVAPFRQVLDWHPSEATALLAAAALGLRGRVEVRDAGLAVTLTDTSTAVYVLPLVEVVALNRLASAVADTTSLADVEKVTRDVCGASEIDYERRKAANLAPGRPDAITAEVDAAVRRFEADVARRGVDYVTFRRIAEAVSLGPRAAASLRRHLVATRPDHDAWPLWSVTAVHTRAT